MGELKWIGVRISCRLSVADEPDVQFDGRIKTAEDIGDGIIRISGALTSGARFVLVNDEGATR